MSIITRNLPSKISAKCKLAAMEGEETGVVKATYRVNLYLCANRFRTNLNDTTAGERVFEPQITEVYFRESQLPRVNRREAGILDAGNRGCIASSRRPRLRSNKVARESNREVLWRPERTRKGGREGGKTQMFRHGRGRRCETISSGQAVSRRPGHYLARD